MYSQLLFFLPVFISAQRKAIVSPQDPGCVEDFNKIKACMNLDHPFISRIDDIPRSDSAENLAILQEVRQILHCLQSDFRLTCRLAHRFRKYLNATEMVLDYYQNLESKCLANGTLYQLVGICYPVPGISVENHCVNWTNQCLFYALGMLKQCTDEELGIFAMFQWIMGHRCREEAGYGKLWAKYLGLS